MNRLEHIESELTALRTALTKHPLYNAMQNMEDVKVFMEHHVFAVWDFMSLLKALQIELTCTSLPWMPKTTSTTAHFINEIVLGEESDVNEVGEFMSHYEMYIDAMQQVGASTTDIRQFQSALKSGVTIKNALLQVNAPESVQAFVNYTFDVIKTGEPHKIASAFTFGREDVIPDMFLKIIDNAEAKSGKDAYNKLTYYLQRHIDVDGDEHGPLSLQMIAELCGDDDQKWTEALEVAKLALQYRIQLWDGVVAAIEATVEV